MPRGVLPVTKARNVLSDIDWTLPHHRFRDLGTFRCKLKFDFYAGKLPGKKLPSRCQITCKYRPQSGGNSPSRREEDHVVMRLQKHRVFSLLNIPRPIDTRQKIAASEIAMQFQLPIPQKDSLNVDGLVRRPSCGGSRALRRTRSLNTLQDWFCGLLHCPSRQFSCDSFSRLNDRDPAGKMYPWCLSHWLIYTPSFSGEGSPILTARILIIAFEALRQLQIFIFFFHKIYGICISESLFIPSWSIARLIYI